MSTSSLTREAVVMTDAHLIETRMKRILRIRQGYYFCQSLAEGHDESLSKRIEAAILSLDAISRSLAYRRDQLYERLAELQSGLVIIPVSEETTNEP